MSRAAFSSFARNAARFQNVRAAAMKGMNPMFMKVKPVGNSFNFVNPEVLLKNQRVSQLTKIAYRSRRLCSLQLQKMQLGAISVLLNSCGEILIDFEDLINSLEDDQEEELLRRTSLLVQSQRSG